VRKISQIDKSIFIQKSFFVENQHGRVLFVTSQPSFLIFELMAYSWIYWKKRSQAR